MGLVKVIYLGNRSQSSTANQKAGHQATSFLNSTPTHIFTQQEFLAGK
jgi:hypothetical protein